MINIKTKIKKLQESKIKISNVIDKETDILVKILEKYPNIKADSESTFNNFLYFSLKSKKFQNKSFSCELITEASNNISDETVVVYFYFEEYFKDTLIRFYSNEVIPLIRYNTFTNRLVRFYKFEDKLKKLHISGNLLKLTKLELIKWILNKKLNINQKLIPDNIKKLLTLS